LGDGISFLHNQGGDLVVINHPVSYDTANPITEVLTLWVLIFQNHNHYQRNMFNPLNVWASKIRLKPSANIWIHIVFSTHQLEKGNLLIYPPDETHSHLLI
jgi:hypothetical protein